MFVSFLGCRIIHLIGMVPSLGDMTSLWRFRYYRKVLVEPVAEQ